MPLFVSHRSRAPQKRVFMTAGLQFCCTLLKLWCVKLWCVFYLCSSTYTTAVSAQKQHNEYTILQTRPQEALQPSVQQIPQFLDSTASATQPFATVFAPTRPKIALALSGGGARGMAQIGVLRVFERAGIPIDYIVGTSIGALIGGLYASGYTADELDSILTGLNWSELAGSLNEREREGEFIDQKAETDRSLLSLRFKNGKFVAPEAISRGFRLTTTLNSLVWKALYQARGNFNSLKIPFRAIATDLVRGESVALQSGDLVTALRASATFPLRYTPVKMDSMLLVDGGLLANVPVKTARSLGADIVIAVDNTSPLLARDELNAVWTIADQAATVMMRRLSTAEAATADILLTPLSEDSVLMRHSNADFTNFRRLIEAGERSALAVLPSLLKRLPPRMQQPRMQQQSTESQQYISFSSISPEYPVKDEHSAQKYNHPLRVQSIAYTGVSALYRDSLEAYICRYTDSLATPDVLSRLHDSVAHWYQKRGHSLAQVHVRRFPVYAAHTKEDQLTQHISTSGLKADTHDTANSHQWHGAEHFSESASIILIACEEGFIKSVRYNPSMQPLPSNRQTLLERELHLREQTPFNADNVLRSWRGLMATGLFNEIAISSVYRADGGIDVEVRAEERPTLAVRLGARIDNERNVQGGLDIVEDDVFDAGVRASLRVAGGLRNFYGLATLSVPRIFGTAWQFDVRGYGGRTNLYLYRDKPLPLPNFERLRVGEAAIDRLGAKAMISQQIERNGLISAEFRYEQQRFFDFADPSRPALQSLNTLKLAARFDTEDRADFPTVGRVLDLSLEVPLFNISGGAGFSKAQVVYANTVSWGQSHEHMIRPSFQFGFADLTMPQTEFFSLGGEDSFFGMREDEMRGTQIAVVSLAYRYRLPWRVFGMDMYASLRYDTGTTWATPALIRISDMRQGVGVSAALDTPFGAARVSLGQSFYFIENPNGVVWGPALAYFSIGIRI